MIDICLLGTAGTIPLPNRWLTSLVVRYNGKMILIDCGEGTQIPLKTIGWSFKTISAVCFTHYHADHISGLPGLLLTMGNFGREEELTIIGPAPLEKIYNGLSVIFPELPFKVKLIEITEYTKLFQIEDFYVNTIKVDHMVNCYSYSIEIKRSPKFDVTKAKENNVPMSLWKALQKGESVEFENKIYSPDLVCGEERKGIKITYSTDTRPVNQIITLAENSDLFICEGMYGDDEKFEKVVSTKHMLFSEAATLAKSANVKELWLTHFSPALEKPNDFLQNAKNIFENTFCGYDMMKKTLKFD